VTPTATTPPPRTRRRPPARPPARDAGRSASGARPRAGASRAVPHRSASRPSSPTAATATAAPLPRRTTSARPRPELRVVETPAQRRRRVLRNRRLAVAGTLLAALAVFTVVAFHVMLAQGQVGLARLQSQVQSAEREYQQARYAHARAESPERIIALAAKLGLVPADRPPLPVAVPQSGASASGTGAGTLDGYTSVKASLADGP